MFRNAPGIRLIPEVVFKVERYLGDLVAVFLEIGADSVPLFERVTLPEKRIAKPVPVLSGHKAGEQWLVFSDLRLKLCWGKVVKRRVGISVTAKQLIGSTPGL